MGNENNRMRVAVGTGMAVGGLIGLGIHIVHALNEPAQEQQEERLEYAPNQNVRSLEYYADTTDDYVQGIPINSLLEDIHKHFVRIKDEDFTRYFNVFSKAFQKILDDMRSIDRYFYKYSKQFQFSGSHSDNLKIGIPDEFDMNVVIRLPISMKHDVELQSSEAGFVMIKLNEQFSNLFKKPEWESCHKVTASWHDSENYFLQDKLRNWIESLFQRALNAMERNYLNEPIIKVDGIPYSIKIYKSGPACTINLKTIYDDDFSLNVDFVPVLEFQLEKLPSVFRPYKQTYDQMSVFVVPKPMKKLISDTMRNRSWRVTFHDQEKKLLHGSNTMKSIIRLIKKMRDNLKMKHLHSYFIKTLFLWENDAVGEHFWNQSLVILLKHMLEKLYEALFSTSIPYYWDKRYNLLETFENKIQGYSINVYKAIYAIGSNDKATLTKLFLNETEYKMFKRKREELSYDDSD